MSKKLVILSLILLYLSSSFLEAQPKSAFTGDIDKFRSELTAFMGPNLNAEQHANMDKFLLRWDSAAFSRENMSNIVDISNQLSGRSMRALPHFNDFLKTINYFVDFNKDAAFFTSWLRGLSEITFNPRISTDNIVRYFKNTGSMIKEQVLSETGSVKWKVKNSKLQFAHDTVFYVTVSDATLTCYSQQDSTELYNVSGVYYPEIQLFRGSKGIVTWEKAGYSRKDVYAEISNYTINTARNSFTIDSARLNHLTYFQKPELGKLSDQTTSFSNKEKANFPQFITYRKEFRLKNIFKGVNYEGGLSFEGASVKGTGENYSPARIYFYRNDTLYLKVGSKEFLFSKTGFNSSEASASIYLGSDSIYHSNWVFLISQQQNRSAFSGQIIQSQKVHITIHIMVSICILSICRGI